MNIGLDDIIELAAIGAFVGVLLMWCAGLCGI
jgi:hypothetical protein